MANGSRNFNAVNSERLRVKSDKPGFAVKTCGGIYLWISKEDADRLYTQDWKSFVREKYGADVSLIYFECPVVVDNISHEVLTDG